MGLGSFLLTSVLAECVADCSRTDLDCFSQHLHAQLTAPCSGRVPVALLGAGTFARKAHLPSLKTASDCFDLVAVWSRSHQSVESLDLGNKVQRLVGEEGWKQLLYGKLQRPVELLDVVLPFPQQFRFIKEALGVGLAVVSEKPIASNSSEAETLMAGRFSPSGRWWVAENWRFEPAFHIAAAAVAAKSVGEVLAFTGSSLSFMPETMPYMLPGTWRMSHGNWILDVGVHFAAAFRLALGEVELVHVIHRSVRPELQPFDSFAATMFSQKAIGTWIFSLSVPKPTVSEISGLSDLELQISGSNGTLIASRGKVELRDAFGHLISQLRINAPSVTYTLRAVAQACLGMRVEGISPDEALKDLKLVEAILEQRRQKITTDHWMEL